MTNSLDEKAVFRIARNDDFLIFRSLQDRIARIEAKAVLLLLRAMALLTVFYQNRPNVLLKEFDLIGRKRLFGLSNR